MAWRNTWMNDFLSRLACCDTDMQCIRPSHETIDSDYTTVPCGVDEQGFDAPGVDALYDLQYDPQVR